MPREKRRWVSAKVYLDPEVGWGDIDALALEMGFEHPHREGVPDHSALLRAVARGADQVVDTFRIAAALGKEKSGEV